MKQYLLSIYQPDGDPPPPRDPRADHARRGRAERRRCKAAGAWVFTGGLHPPSTATVVRADGGDVLDDRRAVRRGQGAHRRVLDHQGAGPRRRARVGAQGCGRVATLPIEVRPFSTWPRAARARARARCRACACARGDRARLPRGVRPRGGRPGPRLRRHRRRRGGGPGRLRRRRASGGRPPGCRRARPAGSSPPRATGRSTGCAARRPATPSSAQAALLHARDEPDGGGPRARRPAAADLHLLPPGARPGRAGRAHAAAARRAHHGRDRARLPRAGADDGPAAGPGQGQDPRREDPVPRPGGGRPARPAAGGARRRLPHLQRGLRGELGRRRWSATTCAPRPSGSAGCWPSSCPTSPRCSGCSR